MDWLILIVLVPAVIVPLVIVWGFAGCSSFTGADPQAPEAPFSLVSRGISTSRIDLTWQHNSAGGLEFRVGRQRVIGTWDDNYGTPSPPTSLSFSDTGLGEGEFHNYRVTAIVSGTPSNPSGTSNESGTRTWMWEKPYDKPLSTDGGNFSGDCMVQRIDKSLLPLKGKARQVKITLRGSNAQPLQVDRVYISQAAPPGSMTNPSPNPWDSNTDLTRVFDSPSGGPPKVLAPNTTITLGPIDYVLNNTSDLIVALDIGASGAVRRRETDVGASTCYVNNSVTEAAKADRISVAAQWPEKPAAGTHAVYLVEKIEVLTAAE